jgi:ergothioneine biosynthesis protein EgtB
VYRERRGAPDLDAEVVAVDWQGFGGGLVEVGFDGEGFAFDNERPRHRVFLEDFEIASRPVSNAEWLEFMRDGGYERPELWLSSGWATIQAEGIRAPLYWNEQQGLWTSFTTSGRLPVVKAEPVCHVSYYEADAFASWAGARLPTEQEWETAAEQEWKIATAGRALAGNFVESGRLRPAPGGGWFGDVWEWTASPYVGYPRYRHPAGALGEYNGKFMADQWVLRGGSCATPRSHVRTTYRNFFPASARWQFFGLRLARDAS